MARSALPPDHYLSLTDPGRVATDAWTLIGALAARTSKLRLGTLVSPVTFRHPAVVAKAAATADQISGGRIEVGMGAGWMAAEHERFGFDFPETKERVRTLAEHVEQVDRLLRGPAHGPAAPSAANRRRQRGPRDRGPGGAVRRRVQHLRRRCGRGRPASAEARRGMRAGGPRSRVPGLLLMTPFVLGREHARRFVKVFPTAGSADEWFEELKRRGLAGSTVDLVDGLREFEAIGVERVMLQHVVHDDLDVVAALGEIAAAL